MDAALDTRQQLAHAIAVLGSSVTYTALATPATPRTIRALVQMVSPRDEAIVNAYGAEAMYVDVLPDALPVRPVKFDTLDIAGKKVQVHVVHDVLVAGVVCGFHMIVRGK